MRAAAAFAFILLVAGATARAGGATTTIRYATLTPNQPTAMRLLKAWKREIGKQTEGRVGFTFYPGGIAGDEKTVMRKMKLGQLDGTELSSIALATVHGPIVVLSMPGLIKSVAQFERVEKEFAGEWNPALRNAGYELLGWYDVGYIRVFSKQPILRPSDFQRVRPWVYPDEPIFPEYLKLIGANGVTLSLPEVLPALQTGMVDTVFVSAVGAVALQWFRHLSHMSKATQTMAVGGMVLRQEVFAKLPKDDQEAIREATTRLLSRGRKYLTKLDKRSHKTLLKRGMVEFDPTQHMNEWVASEDKLKQRVVGRIMPRALVDRAAKVAGRP